MSLALQEAGPVGDIDSTRCRPQRVLIVDESELVQAGLRALLGSQSWVSSCLGASSTSTAMDIARRRQPQLILVSSAIEGEAGLGFCREVAAALPMARVVVMSGHGRVARSLARAHGAVGFLSLGLPAEAIVDVVRRVAEGAAVFPRETLERSNGLLSRREMDVLRHLVAGLSNPEVAAALNLSRHTVKQHTSVVYRKLGVRNRAQAASRAQQLGLVA
ncbi:response regulator transcription factor [Aeromicrobium sp. 50.2.37]|uniref:response regulator transcription factor n=1 Tax=Aeromicrobium sp. 50.2.37 TaxID=2969305 RepID=UPI00214FDD5B|nr:response regulator transcription factor [Aeromicrobium sp. 50.2.37]MCR4512643.1 response regulator transcription factor [Aeromicrobium sp. 50.2.37]